MSRPIEDLNGAAKTHLAQVKKSEGKSSFKSSISDAKLAKLSEEIANAVLKEIKGSDDYNRDLQDKLSDVIMGRITSLKKKSDLTSDDLSAIQESIEAAIEALKDIAEENKDLLEKIVQKCLDYETSRTEILEELKLIKESQNTTSTTTTEKVEEESSGKTDETDKGSQTSDFSSIQDFISQNIQTFQSNFDSISSKIEELQTNLLSNTQLLNTGITDGFTNLLQAIGQKLDAINPLKATGKSKKEQKEAKRLSNSLDKLIKRVNDVFDNFKDYFLNFLADIIIPAAKILAKGINIILKPVIAAFWTTIGPLLAIVAVGIAAALPILAKAIEEIAPYIGQFIVLMGEAINKVIDLVGKVFDFVANKIWPFFEKELWPFLKNEVWPQIKKFIDFLYTEVWPFAKEMIRWLRDEIITPVWKEFVLPLLNWIVKKFLPWFDKYVLPILADVLKLIDRVLKEVVEKIILPIVQGLGQVIGAVADAITKVVNELGNALKAILDNIVKVVNAVGDAITKVVTTIGDTISKVVTALGDTITAILENIKKIINAVGDAITKVVNAIGDSISKVVNALGDTLTAILEDIKKIINAVSDSIIAIVNGVKDALLAPLNVIKAVFDGIGDIVKNVFNFLNDCVVQALNNIKPQVIDILSKKLPGLIDKLVSFVDVTLGVLLSVMNGVKSAIDFMKELVTDLSRIIKLYVVAPLAGLKRWINSKLILFENMFWLPSFEWGKEDSYTDIGKLYDRIVGAHFVKNYIFLGKKIPFGESISKSQLQDNPDEGKSLSELVGEEMDKTKKEFEKEDKAAAASAELKKQNFTPDILNRINQIYDLLSQSVDVKLNAIIRKLGIEVELPKKTDQAAIKDAALQAAQGSYSDVNSINNQSASQGQDVSEAVSEESQSSRKRESSQNDNILQFLYKLGDAINQNFEIVKKKLDTPQLMPIPMIGNNNQALQDL